MTLTVEDGTGLSTSESYISVSDADTYHANRGNNAWGLTVPTTLKEAALRRATDFITGEYRRRWAGSRISLKQALDWPRFLVPVQDVPGGYGPSPAYVASTIVPTEVINACAELALRALTSSLNPDLTRGVLEEDVGVLKVVYDPNSSQRVRYPQIDALLAPYLKGNGGVTVGLTR